MVDSLPDIANYVKNNKIKVVPVGDVIPYENNPRMNADAVDYVANSIKAVGFRSPIIVDENMVVIAGHTRLKAAKKLGMDKVPVMIAKDMTPEQVKLYRLADNKVAEKSGWDFEALDLELEPLKDIFDLESFGFEMDLDTPEYFDADEDELGEETEYYDADDEEEEEFEEPAAAPATQIKRGDVFQLGDHRLMCGDATDADDLERLMDGETADIAFTSPPYNAGFIGRPDREREGQKYINDKDQKTDAAYFEFIDSSLEGMMDHAEEVFLNMGVVSGSKHTIINLLSKWQDSFKDFIYWKKANPVPSIAKGVISSATELIMAFGHNNTRSFRKEIGIYYGVIEGPVASGNPYSKVHRATFPMYLPTEVITTFTDEGALVLDTFGGTGTTMIACERTHRRCNMMEIEPQYCQIIVDRWELETGQKAQKA